LIYPYDIKHARAEPKGAPEIDVMALLPPVFIIGFPGKKGAK
jgi:hypothetical protein